VEIGEDEKSDERRGDAERDEAEATPAGREEERRERKEPGKAVARGGEGGADRLENCGEMARVEVEKPPVLGVAHEEMTARAESEP
jgi:hypothetical protein